MNLRTGQAKGKSFARPGSWSSSRGNTEVIGSESAAWIGGKIELSESEGFSGLCFGGRDDVAQATENREVPERSWQHQDRDITRPSAIARPS